MSGNPPRGSSSYFRTSCFVPRQPIEIGLSRLEVPVECLGHLAIDRFARVPWTETQLPDRHRSENSFPKVRRAIRPAKDDGAIGAALFTQQLLATNEPIEWANSAIGTPGYAAIIVARHARRIVHDQTPSVRIRKVTEQLTG